MIQSPKSPFAATDVSPPANGSGSGTVSVISVQSTRAVQESEVGLTCCCSVAVFVCFRWVVGANLLSTGAKRIDIGVGAVSDRPPALL